jgi:4-amino-4-deoxy-L-arabinose transferase
VTPTDRDFAARRARWSVLLLGLLVGLAFQGTRNLWEPDEGRYTNVAHQMVGLGDWLVPHLDPDRPHFTKPPLTYWTLAASFSAFGNNEWAARLPNALAFALTALLVFGIARRMALPDPLLAAGIWMTLWGPVAAANVVTTDTLLALFETLAVFGFIATGILDRDAELRRGGWRLMWLGFGLAFLTKGPPGLLPLAAIVAFLAWRRRPALPRLFDPLGLALFAATGLSWYLVLIWRSPDLLDYFLVRETVERIATGEHHRNAGWLGWLVVYLPTFLVGSLPWIAIAGTAWRSRVRDAAVPAVGPDLRRFLLLWFALPLAVFVLAQSRLPLYVLPLFVPAALALSAGLRAWKGAEWNSGRVLLTSFAAAIALKGAGALWHPEQDAARFAAELARHVDLASVDEIAFVDGQARYGLKHYTGLDIVQLESGPGSIARAGYAEAGFLCDELATGKSLLLIAPLKRAAEIQLRIDGCSAGAGSTVKFGRWVLWGPLRPGASKGQ